MYDFFMLTCDVKFWYMFFTSSGTSCDAARWHSVYVVILLRQLHTDQVILLPFLDVEKKSLCSF